MAALFPATQPGLAAALHQRGHDADRLHRLRQLFPDTRRRHFNRESDVMLISTIVAGNSAAESGPEMGGIPSMSLQLIQRVAGTKQHREPLFGVDPLLGPLPTTADHMTHASCRQPVLDRAPTRRTRLRPARLRLRARRRLHGRHGRFESRDSAVPCPDPRNRSKNVLVIIGTSRATVSPSRVKTAFWSRPQRQLPSLRENAVSRLPLSA